MYTSRHKIHLHIIMILYICTRLMTKGLCGCQSDVKVTLFDQISLARGTLGV